MPDVRTRKLEATQGEERPLRILVTLFPFRHTPKQDLSKPLPPHDSSQLYEHCSPVEAHRVQLGFASSHFRCRRLHRWQPVKERERPCFCIMETDQVAKHGKRELASIPVGLPDSLTVSSGHAGLADTDPASSEIDHLRAPEVFRLV